jgi:Lytic transglycolase
MRRAGEQPAANGVSGSSWAAERSPWRRKYRQWPVWCWHVVWEMAAHQRRTLRQFLGSRPSIARTTRDRPRPARFTIQKNLPALTARCRSVRACVSRTQNPVAAWVVTDNDRGPFTKGRVIDLSLAAAKELRMIGRGLMKVTAALQ